MSKSAKGYWEAALGVLELQVTKANYQTWLKDSVGISHKNGQFTVGVPNTFTVEWLEKRLHNLIQKTISGIIDNPVEIAFQVYPGKGAENRRAPAPKRAANQQSFNTKYSFPSFIVGSCNRLAYAAAMGVAENPGTVYNPLFIYGGVGLGKTHLLHAIGQFVIQNARQVIYVTAEQFTNDFISGIRERSTENFRNKYRTADLLLIDDIQFIAGKEQTQEGLFHTFNDLHTADRQIILSSDRPPKSLGLLEDRLRSRFEWGLIVDIQPPDFETRVAILQARAEELKSVIALDVLHLIARRVRNNIRELEGALNRVLAYAQLTNATITPELASESLAEIAASDSRRSPTAELIINTVAEYFELAPELLLGKRRDKRISFARQVTMYLLREEMSSSWTEIGRELGGRDHSTILHGYGKISGEIDASSALRRDVLEIKEIFYSKTS